MISVQFIDKDGGLSKLDEHFKRMFINTRDSVVALGHATQDTMKEMISKKTGQKRGPSSGNLARSIGLYFWGDENTIIAGIGSIKVMNEQAPYWRIINYGGQIKSGYVPGYFGSYNKPEANGAGEPFYYRPYSKGSDEGNAFFMNPMKPIEPTNYIEATAMWLQSQITIMRPGRSKTVTVR